MNTIKISYDDQGYRVKPSGDEVGRISNKIARSARKFDRGELKRVITKIGSEGCTFCPATFKNGKRNKDNFEQQQLFALDFDNKDPGRKVSFEDIRERADQNELSILFAYDTLSSTDHDKFRVVFANDVPIHDRRVAEAVQLALGEMFPEADPSCFKDASKLYYGGKKLIYYDDSLPETSIESVFRNYTYYTRKKYKDNHYKEHIRGFSKKTGIALTEKGLLDVTVTDHLPETDDPTEDHGATQYSTNGKNSPIAIIYDKSNSNIIEDGEIFPNKYYLINFSEYYPPWEPPVSRFRATRKWYFPPSEPPQHIVAAHIFDFTINLLIVILGELLMQYHQIIYREVFLCLRRQKSEVFWNFWEKI